MDNLRGQFPEYDGPDDDDLDDDETGHELPPLAIGQDERRMQVRAYNFWASLLEHRTFPLIESLKPDDLPDFGPYSVLLDFTGGIENPAIAFLGGELAEECGTSTSLKFLSDVPSRSLLSRITDHYMQILANQAPIGFEAEFVNQRGATIMYRGILLPFSSNDDAIDYIYGVINWKELADQQTTDELMLQIDQVLDPAPRRERGEAPLTEWADGPVDLSNFPMIEPGATEEPDDEVIPAPEFGSASDFSSGDSGETPTEYAAPGAEYETASPEDETAGPEDDTTGTEDETADPAYETARPMELADWLASARELAQLARASDERSRRALYAAIARAYDFAIAAAEEPDEFSELVADAGLTVQERAPMTPVVKLVFGADYDKTRLAEYAAVLGHAKRKELGRGELADYLENTSGGLKGIVAEERRLRRAESPAPRTPPGAPRESIARKLRQLETRPISGVASEGSEFALLVARRLEDGRVVLLGEVSGDVPLLERAAKHLLG